MEFSAAMPLSEIAILSPRSISVLKRHGLDYCCGGQNSLLEACQQKGLDVKSVLDEIASQYDKSAPVVRWDHKPVTTLIAFILDRFHKKHAEDLVMLLQLAKKVETVHADHPQCPKGLYHLLTVFTDELMSHMEKEESVLFPWIEQVPNVPPEAPVGAMMYEHESHNHRIDEIRAACNNFVPPEGACTSWRALYSGVQTLVDDLMEHIHLENNVLFPMALHQDPVKS